MYTTLVVRCEPIKDLYNRKNKILASGSWVGGYFSIGREWVGVKKSLEFGHFSIGGHCQTTAPPPQIKRINQLRVRPQPAPQSEKYFIG